LRAWGVVEVVNVRLLAVLVAVVVIAGVAMLAYTTLGSVTVEKPYYAETPKAIAVYITIHNGKLKEVCLVRAELAEPGMAMVEIHETVMKEGVHEMRPVERLCIPPRGTLEMKPGGYHIMIMGDNETIKAITADKTVTIRLTFDDGTQIEVKATPAGEAGGSHHH
jgi:copper(I)-binding protein